jgi:hypothetical protein
MCHRQKKLPGCAKSAVLPGTLPQKESRSDEMTMKRMLTVISCLLALYADVATAAPLRPGKWEVTLQTQQPIVSEPMTATMCVMPDRVNPGPPSLPANGDCKVSGTAMANDVLTFSIQCPKTNVNTSTKITYGGATYSGTVTIQRDNLTIVQTIDAKWVGPCDVP